MQITKVAQQRLKFPKKVKENYKSLLRNLQEFNKAPLLPKLRALTFVSPKRIEALEKILFKNISNIIETFHNVAIRKVKIVQNRSLVVVEWLSTGHKKRDLEIEKFLPTYSKNLRQQLIDLHITNIVPPLIFTKYMSEISDEQTIASNENKDCYEDSLVKEIKKDTLTLDLTKNLINNISKISNNIKLDPNISTDTPNPQFSNPYGLDRNLLADRIMQRLKSQSVANHNDDNAKAKTFPADKEMGERTSLLKNYLKECNLNRKRLVKMQKKDLERVKREMLVERF